jgi:PPOX class probable F420-dependent enzyme
MIENGHVDLLALFRTRLEAERNLAVLITTSPANIDPQVSVVNAGIISHPTTGISVVAFVGRQGAKLANLRRNPRATLVARAGWEWVSMRGPVELCGPTDPHPTISTTAVPELLRAIYHAAGGQHPNLDEYDNAMRAEQRSAVLVTIEHLWTNPAGSEHKEPSPANIPHVSDPQGIQ